MRTTTGLHAPVALWGPIAPVLDVTALAVHGSDIFTGAEDGSIAWCAISSASFRLHVQAADASPSAFGIAYECFRHAVTLAAGVRRSGTVIYQVDIVTMMPCTRWCCCFGMLTLSLPCCQD